jgi:hypothetical protein
MAAQCMVSDPAFGAAAVKGGIHDNSSISRTVST